jgi:acyl-coenzyme A thioesterase PaaI-like protein
MAITLLENAPRNQINSVLRRLVRLPQALRLPLFDFLFGRVTRFYRTAKVKAERIGPHRVTLRLANRSYLRNHVGGIHAVAMTLPAEYAAGIVLAQHLPPEAVVVLRRIHMDLHKPIRGAIRACATLSAEQSRSLGAVSRGEMDVPVQIEDETGQIPASGVMCMAWFPRKQS